MIRHKNGKNKPLYIGGQKYDGSKTVVVELAPDKSEYKNFFLTYIAGYDEYKLVFCPVDLENMVPLETHIYSNEDCTVEIALITEIVEGTNDVKVLFPDGKQAIFLFSNTKSTNGLVDFETMKDYVADYVEEHGGSGGGAIEQPLNLKQSPVSEYVPYNGTTPVYFETNTAYTKLFENVRENEDTTKENYSKTWVIFSFAKSDLKDENTNISFILKFCEAAYGGDGANQHELKIKINIESLSYSIESEIEMYENQFFPIQTFLSVYRYDFRYYVAIKKVTVNNNGNFRRLYSLYGSVNVRQENSYLEDTNNISFLSNDTNTQITASGDNLHNIYKLYGAQWIDADQLDDFVQTLEVNKKRYYTFYFDLDMMKNYGGAWYHNKMLIPNNFNIINYIYSTYLLGDNNLRNDYGKCFMGITNYNFIHQIGLPVELNNFFRNCDQLVTINIGEEIRAKSIDGAFYDCSRLVEIIGIINLTYLEQLPTNFLWWHVKYVKIKGLPANTVFTETLFKTWDDISWESTAYMLINANRGNEYINIHVTQFQYDRLLTEAINDTTEDIDDENDFLSVLQTKYYTNIIIDGNN